MVEGVAQFKYLGHPLDQTGDNWMAIRQNVKWEWKVWGILRKILRREGVDIKVSEMLYRVVVQAVLLFGLDYWVLLSTMEEMVEGSHTGFLHQITGNRAWRNTGRTWVLK